MRFSSQFWMIHRVHRNLGSGVAKVRTTGGLWDHPGLAGSGSRKGQIGQNGGKTVCNLTKWPLPLAAQVVFEGNVGYAFRRDVNFDVRPLPVPFELHSAASSWDH